jgi:hypothetical protein
MGINYLNNFKHSHKEQKRKGPWLREEGEKPAHQQVEGEYLLWVEGELCDKGPGWDREEGEKPAHQQVEGEYLLWVEGELCDKGPGWDREEGEEPAHQQVEGVVPVGVSQEHIHHQDVVHVQALNIIDR